MCGFVVSGCPIVMEVRKGILTASVYFKFLSVINISLKINFFVPVPLCQCMEHDFAMATSVYKQMNSLAQLSFYGVK